MCLIRKEVYIFGKETGNEKERKEGRVKRRKGQ